MAEGEQKLNALAKKYGVELTRRRLKRADGTERGTSYQFGYGKVPLLAYVGDVGTTP